MKSRRASIVLLALTAASLAPEGLVGQKLTAQQWREDLAFLAETLRREHPNPFHAIRESTFDEAVRKLDARISELADHEVLVQLARIVASLEDGHTAVRGGFDFLTGQFPLIFECFADGIFVTEVSRLYPRAVGARLLRIGDATAAEAFEAVSTMTPRDNDATLRARAPDLLASPEALHALGIIPDRGEATFTLEDAEGEAFELRLAAVPFEGEVQWIGPFATTPRPLYLTRGDEDYWFTMLEGHGTLYVKYNRVRNALDESVADFVARVESRAKGRDVERVVLDIRHNGGGNDYFNAPFVEWIKRSPHAAEGDFYVVIGRRTFSAAVKLATRLDLETDVIFVGEPTGGRPNHFGDAESFLLPNSGLRLTVSSRYWEDAGPDDRRSAIEPDIPVRVRSEDYFAGLDPVLEAIHAASRKR